MKECINTIQNLLSEKITMQQMVKEFNNNPTISKLLGKNNHKIKLI